MNLSNKNIIHINKDGIQYLQFRRLLKYKDIIDHAYTLGLEMDFRTSRANNIQLSEKEYKKNIDSYKKIANSINSNYIKMVKPRQEHTSNIQIVDRKVNIDKPDFDLEKYKRTDGLITNKKDIILTTTNADCILLLLFDPIKKVVANVHSGWRGTVQRISIKAVQIMHEQFNCDYKDIICCICPSIRKCHFEVDTDVKEIFEEEFKDIAKQVNFIEEKAECKKWNIDTVLINIQILKNIGLQEENIIDCGICTVCNKDIIHSFRVEKESYKLETALIGLKL